MKMLVSVPSEKTKSIIHLVFSATCLLGFMLSMLINSSYVLAKEQASIQIRHPYIRLMPPGAPNTAAYMTISSTENNQLIKVTGSVARNIELHEHIHQNGIMQMRPVDKIDLPAGNTVHLQPGGLHIMLIGVTPSLQADEQYSLQLHFAKGAPVTQDFVVQYAPSAHRKQPHKGQQHKQYLKNNVNNEHKHQEHDQKHTGAPHTESRQYQEPE